MTNYPSKYPWYVPEQDIRREAEELAGDLSSMFAEPVTVEDAEAMIRRNNAEIKQAQAEGQK